MITDNNNKMNKRTNIKDLARRAAMALLLALVTTTSAWAAIAGFVDIVWPHNGSIEVSGWTYDTDYEGTPIGVHVQIWDNSGSTLIKTVGFPANVHRDNVGDKGFHGFVPIDNAGTYMVKVAAMGVSSSGYLNCSTPTESGDFIDTFYATPGAPWIISYDANGGWNAPAPQTNHWGIPSSLSTVQPTRPGYTFTGWNTAADGTGEAHTSGDTAEFFFWQSDVTLYAQWTPTYTVTYNANGGSGAPAAQEKIHDIPLALSTALPSHVGYYFTGWNTAANGSGIAYSPGATYTGNAALTLYAQWTKTSVSYLAYNTGTKAYETRTANNWSEVTSTTSTMGAANTETWYLVNSNVTDWSRIEVLGTVHLILVDSYSLRAEKGIHVPTGATLNIYGQSGGTGELHGFATTDGQAGIGGNYEEAGGTLTIHGGSIEAIGYRWGAGIGGGRYGNGGHITIYGGTINATGGPTGAGIGGGVGANCGTVTIIGGTVIAQAQTAYDGDNSQAIGSGAGTGISDGSLIIDNIKVYSSAEAANPVAPANRLSTCQSKYARLVPCTAHNYVNGACTICGVYLTLYGITYDGNKATSGTVPASFTEYQTGQTVTVLGNTGNLERTGYTFSGWNTAANGSGTDYAPGTTFTISSSVTLYAKWTPNDYSITYDLAGGTVATPNPTSYTIESDAITLNNPTRDGYVFTGWTGTGLTEPTMTVTIPKGSTGNRTYTATWTVPVGSIDYVYSHNGSISFGGWAYEESNPSTPIPVQVQIWSGENLIKTVEFMANNPREDLGYNCGFTGVIPLDEGTYKVKIKAIGLNQVYLIWPGVGEDIYPQVGAPWIISYDANGGTGAPEPQTNHWAVPSTLSTVQPTRPGYTFAGWNTAADGTGVPYPSGYTDIFYVWEEDRTLYAQWTLNTYTIAYNLAGGTVATDNPTAYTVLNEDITLNNPTREGYIFTGWTGTYLTEATMIVTIASGSTGNREYTATWTYDPNVQYNMYNPTTGTFEERWASNTTLVTNSTTTMGAANNETWYVVNSNVNSWGRIEVRGTVNLILNDGATLNASRGITVNSGNTLNIYGQTSGTGTLNATGVKVGGDGTESAAIGSTGSAGGTALGIITIHGGRITANGAGWSAGIGGGIRGGGGLVAIYGGTVNATGHDGTSEAIGHGSSTEVAVSKSIAKGLRVTVNNSSSPVAYSSRVSALAQKVVKVEPCTAHNLSNNTCIYCGITYYGVTYDGNNATSGTVPTDANVYYTNNTVTVLGNTGNLERSGYLFAGWNTAANGSGTDYAPGTTFTISSSVTLYAKWTPNDYSITYDLAGGTVATPNPTSYTIESDAITLNNPTRDGYVFTGWTGTGLTEPTMTVTIPKGSTGNRTYTATWTVPVGSIDYVYSHNGSISFGGWAYEESNPSTPIPVQVQIWSGENLIKTVEFMANNPREDLGYNCGFTGVIPLDEGTYKVKIKAIGLNQVYLIWPGVGEDIYPQVGAPWIISYDANGGTGAPEPQTNHWAVPSTLSTVQPTRPGYTFAGWNTAADGTGVPYPSGYTDIFYVWEEDRTLYAQWTLNTYTIAYNLAGGTVATDNPTAYTVLNEDITLNNPTREGYIFTGWTGTYLTEATMIVTIASGSTGNREYTATWTYDPNVQYNMYNPTIGTFEERWASNATLVTNSTTTMGADNTETWYELRDNATISSRIEVRGSVHLILRDGKTMNVIRGIAVNEGNSLTIYGQSDGTGALNADAVYVANDPGVTNRNAGIGSNYQVNAGNITIHGGRITANGAAWSAGIGGGMYGGGGSVTIYGGTINARGHDGSSEAIGHGSSTDAVVTKTLAVGLRVFLGNSPVDYGYRMWCITQNSNVVTIAPCTEHNLSKNKCTYCGTILYGVTYDGNKATSGTVPASFTEYQTGQTVTILENTGNLERTGYTFSGWNTAANGSGTDYAPGATFAISSSVTLYAQWSASLLTLANNADNSEAIGLASGDGMYYDVTLAGRTLYKDGDWNTLCLPFDLGNPEAEEGHHYDDTQLEGATVMTLASTDFEDGTLTMTFADATSIEAGKPYLVKWTKPEGYDENPGNYNLVNPVFEDVLVSAATANVETDYADFIGTFSPVTLTGGDNSVLYLGTNNQLYYPAANRTMNACRAYFQLNGITAGDIVRGVKMYFSDEDPDAIGRPTPDPSRNGGEAWYDLNGRKLSGKPTHAGVYIYNGKKQIIK